MDHSGSSRGPGLPRFTDRLALGPSLQVSPFCLGISQEEVVVEAFARGINFFFLSADLHWPRYEGVRRGLARILRDNPDARRQMVIAVTSYLGDHLRFASLFDLFLSFPEMGPPDVLLAGAVVAEEVSRLPQLRQLGRQHSKPIGASFHDRAALLQEAHHAPLDISFVRYNCRYSRAEDELFPYLPERHGLLYTFKSTTSYLSPQRLLELGVPGHLWRPSISDLYRFPLSRPEVDGSLIALDSVAQLDDLEKSLSRGPLSAKQITYLKNLAELESGAAVVPGGR